MKNNTADEIKQGFANIIGNVRIASDNRTQEEIKKNAYVEFTKPEAIKIFKERNPDFVECTINGKTRFYPPNSNVKSVTSDEIKKMKEGNSDLFHKTEDMHEQNKETDTNTSKTLKNSEVMYEYMTHIINLGFDRVGLINNMKTIVAQVNAGIEPKIDKLKPIYQMIKEGKTNLEKLTMLAENMDFPSPLDRHPQIDVNVEKTFAEMMVANTALSTDRIVENQGENI